MPLSDPLTPFNPGVSDTDPALILMLRPDCALIEGVAPIHTALSHRSTQILCLSNDGSSEDTLREILARTGMPHLNLTVLAFGVSDLDDPHQKTAIARVVAHRIRALHLRRIVIPDHSACGGTACAAVQHIARLASLTGGIEIQSLAQPAAMALPDRAGAVAPKALP